MTEQEKKDIEAQFYNSAKIQAAAVISAVEVFEAQFPEDTSEEHKLQTIQSIVALSVKSVEAANKQLAEQLKKQVIASKEASK